jgi:cysteine desulfurase family protein (TIGR01976 family)
MAYDVQKIRNQFPGLKRQFKGQDIVCLDNPAGTQVAQTVLDRMTDCMINTNANLGGVFETSIAAGKLVDTARDWAADFLNGASNEIIFGQNMTSLTFAMSRSIGRDLQPEDEIVLTRADHDGNVAPWLMLAEEKGLKIRWIDLDPERYELDLSQLSEILNPRTRLIAVNYASNITGTITDVKAVCEAAKSVGALVYVDAVQYAPHDVIDVQELGCDFLACSAYKFYGPHYGILWAKAEHLERLTAYKVRAASDEIPNKFVTGTTNREELAGIIGALEHYQWVGQEFGASLSSHPTGRNERQAQLRAGIEVMKKHDHSLAHHLISGLQQHDGIRIVGIDDLQNFNRRVSTVSFAHAPHHPEDIVKSMADEGINVWSGHNYALETIYRLGLMEQGGIVRVGPTHYNTHEEIDRFLDCYNRYLVSKN